ncbi:SRPBCC domain-containing protein [Ornithobacterium rhinotracheale]|uniref:START-like domain-containing protein n=1 Tax=Ornithobacterium rhinotracheale TaxID=28251 RepID=UPI00129CC24E|nr:START-like domain-containing protein [Ornithobacterium rhinotracheale]MRJ09033.1 SRPBCC domain-containing protein [Ornithobacterium rhinotracheale]MRJ11045.1 SRPBCC domain-containing protein [Ornithobacterium rhinotracheale]UOH77160.1 START-like domain-containing protein [Ornithobacterium rhinotracheale]
MSKKKYELEVPVQASPSFLYNYISTPSGLSEWFADNVNSRSDKFTFIWDDYEEVAHLIRSKFDEYVRFRWEQDEDSKYYFELKIQEDELTGDVSLIVTDFAEEDELEEAKDLWFSQLEDLKHIIGS